MKEGSRAGLRGAGAAPELRPDSAALCSRCAGPASREGSGALPGCSVRELLPRVCLPPPAPSAAAAGSRPAASPGEVQELGKSGRSGRG